MFDLFRTKDGIGLLAGCFFLWLSLEMVFFGEPLFRYEGSEAGYRCYTALLVLIAEGTIAAALVGRTRFGDRLFDSPRAACIAGAVATISLLAAYLVPTVPFLGAAAVLWGLGAPLLIGAWCQRLISLVYRNGVAPVLAVLLVAIALSFLLLPRIWRSLPYGIALTSLAPLGMGLALLLRAPSSSRPEARPLETEGTPETEQAPLGSRPFSLTLLALISFLTYLIAYFDFVAPGFRVVVEENSYLYLALFALIVALFVVVVTSGAERMFANGVFLYVMVGVMLLTFLVFFGVLSYVFLGGSFGYALTKLLRRIVKIAMAFILVGFVYQSGLRAVPSFMVTLVLPLVLAKLVQMCFASFEGLRALLEGGLYYYLSGIGFLLLVCWTLFLVVYAQKGEVGNRSEGKALSKASEETEAESAVGRIGARCHLTERETDVLRYLAAGYSLKGIAEALYVSPNTIKTHVAAVYRKLDVHTKQEVINLVNDERD